MRQLRASQTTSAEDASQTTSAEDAGRLVRVEFAAPHEGRMEQFWLIMPEPEAAELEIALFAGVPDSYAVFCGDCPAGVQSEPCEHVASGEAHMWPHSELAWLRVTPVDPQQPL